MASYYVNLDTPSSSGTGSRTLPFSSTQFFERVSQLFGTGSYTDVYYLRGHARITFENYPYYFRDLTRFSSLLPWNTYGDPDGNRSPWFISVNITKKDSYSFRPFDIGNDGNTVNLQHGFIEVNLESTSKETGIRFYRAMCSRMYFRTTWGTLGTNNYNDIELINSAAGTTNTFHGCTFECSQINPTKYGVWTDPTTKHFTFNYCYVPDLGPNTYSLNGSAYKSAFKCDSTKLTPYGMPSGAPPSWAHEFNMTGASCSQISFWSIDPTPSMFPPISGSSLTYTKPNPYIYDKTLDLGFYSYKRIGVGAQCFDPRDSASTYEIGPPDVAGSIYDYEVLNYYRCNLVLGNTYTFTISVTSPFDSMLALLSNDGKTVIAYDNDSGGGKNSKIIYTCPSSGVYYLVVFNLSTFSGASPSSIESFVNFCGSIPGGGLDCGGTTPGPGGRYILSSSSIAPPPPTAVINVVPTTGVAPLTVNVSCVPSGIYTSFFWQFPYGSPSSSTAEDPGSVLYNTYGNKAISLIISGPGGSNVYMTTVDVKAPDPTVNFSASPNPTVPDTDITFTNLSSGDVNYYTWSWGDSTPDAVVYDTASQIHSYSTTGSKTVRLTARSVNGTDHFIEKTIVINAIVRANFTVNPAHIGVKNKTLFSFVNTSSGATSYNWTFTDFASSILETPPSLTFSTEGSKEIVLTATGPGGVASRTDHVYVYCGASASFVGVPRVIKAGKTVSFSATVAPDNYVESWLWTFEGGTPTSSTDQNKEVVYNTAGVYDVTLKASNVADTNTYLENDYITVLSSLGGTLVASPTHLKTNTNVNFSVSDIKGAPTSYVWNYGDGTTQTTIVPTVTKTYTTYGLYSATVKLIDAYEENTLTAVSIYVYKVDFVADKLAATIGENITFTNLCEGSDITGYTWNLGDSITDKSDKSSVVHAYTTAGTYTIQLTLHNPSNNLSTTKTAYITVYGPVSVNFTGTPVEGIAPLTVSFTNLCSNVTSFKWTFGDDGTNVGSTDPNPVHIYQNAGLYTVKLEGQGPIGPSIIETKTDYIHVYAPLVVDFVGAPRIIRKGETVSFDSTVTGDVEEYSWTFGDGGTSDEADPDHTYSTSGYYDVSLTVSNPVEQKTKTYKKYIKVLGDLDVDFSADETIGIIPFTVTFTSVASGNPTGYSWTFGDGGTSTEASPQHVYRNIGIYTVKLVVTDGIDEITKEKIAYIVVGKGDFIATPVAGRKPLVVYFEDRSVFPSPYVITKRIWTFGDGNTETRNDDTITHKYMQKGSYDVNLRFKVNNKYFDVEKPDLINVTDDTLKTCTTFTTLGWLKNPVVKDGDYLTPLAIEDYWGNVETSERSMTFRVYREKEDYRLAYNNSRSKLIRKTLKIALNDNNWHMLGWICKNDDGEMKYFVDDYTLDAEEGKDENGLEYSIAYSYYVRQGGGQVWCPYIYKGGQSLQVYNWRFGLGFIIHDDWIRKLNIIDREKMGI